MDSDEAIDAAAKDLFLGMGVSPCIEGAGEGSMAPELGGASQAPGRLLKDVSRGGGAAECQSRVAG